MIPQCKHIMIVFQAHETSAYMSGFEELTSSTMANMKNRFEQWYVSLSKKVKKTEFNCDFEFTLLIYSTNTGI